MRRPTLFAATCLLLSALLGCPSGDPADPCAGAACDGADPCVGVDCDDGNPCTDDSCDGGTCQHVSNDAACDDGDGCTTGDACSGGDCGGVAVDCGDGVACTTDVCTSTSGSTHTCDHTASAAACDDGDACTSEACDPVTGCSHTAIDCDDGNPCTTDTCSRSLGCQHSGLPAAASCGAATCAGPTSASVHLCSTAAECVADTVSCDHYRCDDGSGLCRTSCDNDGQCAPGHYCLSFACVPIVACTTGADCGQFETCASGACAKELGSGCVVANTCASGYCSPDSVCCDAACNGTCETCKPFASWGTCKYVTAGTDPDNECAGASVCGADHLCTP